MWTITSKTGQVISEEVYYKGDRFIRDIDGNSYATVQIGSQFWMKENLRVTKLNNGKSLQFHNQSNSYSREPAYCWYEHDNTMEQRGCIIQLSAINRNLVQRVAYQVIKIGCWNIQVLQIIKKSGKCGSE